MQSAQAGTLGKKVSGVDDMFEVGIEEMRRPRTDELVVGLCGPIGSPLHKVAAEFARLLEQLYGYECNIIRLSEIIEELRGLASGPTRFERIQKLIENEEIEHGQTVRTTFPKADFFVRAGAEASDMSERIQRLLDLILRTKVITPTIAETAMYQTASAAGNSARLSRQVGAAITDKDGEVLAIGWNDVPRFGGRLVWHVHCASHVELRQKVLQLERHLSQ